MKKYLPGFAARVAVMRFWISTIALLGLVLANGNLPGQEPAYESLFNGKDFAGWKGATGSYEVRDGILVCKKGKSGVLFTEKEVKDCVIRVVYRLPPGGNNGIAVHYPGHGTGSLDGMCEIQLLDDPHQIRQARPPAGERICLWPDCRRKGAPKAGG